MVEFSYQSLSSVSSQRTQNASSLYLFLFLKNVLGSWIGGHTLCILILFQMFRAVLSTWQVLKIYLLNKLVNNKRLTKTRRMTIVSLFYFLVNFHVHTWYNWFSLNKSLLLKFQVSSPIVYYYSRMNDLNPERPMLAFSQNAGLQWVGLKKQTLVEELHKSFNNKDSVILRAAEEQQVILKAPKLALPAYYLQVRKLGMLYKN